MRRGARTRTVAAGLLAAGVLLAGCSSAKTDSSPSLAPSASGSSSAAGSSTTPSRPTAAPVTPASTPVAPPTPGSTQSSVPSQQVTKRKPVALDRRGEAADGVAVALTKVAAVTAKAVGPGEVSGPALALTVRITNDTSQTIDVSSVVVNVTAADKTPAAQMTGPPAKSFSGSLKAGATTSGVYVYTIAKGQRDPVTVEVTVAPTDPVVVFTGRAKR